MPQNKKTSVKKTRVSSKPSTRKKNPKRSSYEYFDQYEELFTMKKKPISVKALKLLSMDLLKWAHGKTEDPEQRLLLRDFFFDRGIPYRTVQDWLKRSPLFKSAVAEAKLMIGGRREIGALTRKYTDKVFLNLWTYDPEWKQNEEWRAKLKNDSIQQAVNTAFDMRQVPSSDIVPELPETKDSDEEKVSE